MKIALLGYGKMGREIEKIALQRNHTIALKIDIDNQQDNNVENLRKADVAIDFSTPASAFANILKCFEANVPVVCGTTGWTDKIGEVEDLCRQKNQSFFWASNYSLGVNLFFALNKYLAGLMNNVDGYNVSIEEIHHIHKLDAPSGTAITLANGIIDTYAGKKKWELEKESDPGTLKITAVREDEVPGTHTITWDSPVDQIQIRHEAKSRQGFALGAVLAAEFVKDKKGVFSMKDLIKL
jgi:4-hydroxy-tetrahydrodipicolinate reductase